MSGAQKIKTFTSRKLDWIACLIADARIHPAAKIIGICIINHVNEKTGECFVSDATLADTTGTSISTVIRARNLLHKIGWLKWRATLGAVNHYAPLFENIAAIRAKLAQKRARRAERYKRKGLSWVTEGGLSPMTDKHLRDNTSKKEESPSGPRLRSEVLRSDANKIAIFEKRRKQGKCSKEEIEEGRALAERLWETREPGDPQWERAARILTMTEFGTQESKRGKAQ